MVFGDWQTPAPLAREVIALMRERMPGAAAVLEPTCGKGMFLREAASAFPRAILAGLDLNDRYVEAARACLPADRCLLRAADFFTVPWEAELALLPEPLLILGNPPWVTSAALGAVRAGNLPEKRNARGRRGIDAKTGTSNFDISEWMISRLIAAARGRRFALAMLCKATVARRVMEHAAAEGWRLAGEVRRVDAHRHFGASVDAVLLVVSPESEGRGDMRWPVYRSLGASAPERWMGVVDGAACSDVDAYRRTESLQGISTLEWRSGLKHDCAAVMELERTASWLANRLGERVEVEEALVHPLLKGSDLAKGRAVPRREVIVTQRRLGEDTESLRERAPRLWRYLQRHRGRFEARKSSVYRGQPPFAMFGVGEYSFAPYKVAICGLYKRLSFTLVEPIGGRAVMVDDTAYFLPCATREQAKALCEALNGPAAREFFEARVFWDAKRPIRKELLRALSLDALLRVNRP